MDTKSNEQSDIINALSSDINVICNAVAGSGKTTTICFMGKEFKDKNIGVLTYNRRLRWETDKILKEQNISNVQIHNFHSFCHSKYKVSGTTDQMILDAIKLYSNDENKIFNYDIIVIDEAQDLTELYVELIKMIIEHNVNLPVMCLIGDVKQTIYSYNGADSRFLTLAHKIFKTKTDIWENKTLSKSYRLSESVTKFMNKCIFKDDYIVGNGVKGFKPRYIFCDAFGDAPINELLYFYFKQYKYDDIIVLAPSIASDLSPVKMLANTLSSVHNIPIFIPTSDGEKLETSTTSNKLIFASFHQVKGLQRKCVLVFGFDNSYYYYYNNDASRSECPNEIYVALTRCTERLTVFHHYKKNFIDFIDIDEISNCCYTNKVKDTNLNLEYLKLKNVDLEKRLFEKVIVKDTEEYVIKLILDINNKNNSLNKPIKMSVTKLLSHLPLSVINEALKFISIEIFTQAKKINVKNPFDSDDEDDPYANLNVKITNEIIKKDNFTISIHNDIKYVENTSEIIGTAIPIIYEYVKFDKIPIIDWIDKELKGKTSNLFSIYNEINVKFRLLKEKEKFTKSDIFQLVTIYNGLQNNLIHKINQIKNYNFMCTGDLNKCLKRLDNNIVLSKENPKFEVYYETSISMDIEGYDEPVKRVLNGFIDCIDKKTVWEFKTVSKIENVHILQLAIYAYLFYSNMEHGKEFKLLNIVDGTKYVVKGKISDFVKLVHCLFLSKFSKPKPLTNKQFIKKYSFNN